jgi:hypothetical protein
MKYERRSKLWNVDLTHAALITAANEFKFNEFKVNEFKDSEHHWSDLSQVGLKVSKRYTDIFPNQ